MPLQAYTQEMRFDSKKNTLFVDNQEVLREDLHMFLNADDIRKIAVGNTLEALGFSLCFAGIIGSLDYEVRMILKKTDNPQRIKEGIYVGMAMGTMGGLINMVGQRKINKVVTTYNNRNNTEKAIAARVDVGCTGIKFVLAF